MNRSGIETIGGFLRSPRLLVLAIAGGLSLTAWLATVADEAGVRRSETRPALYKRMLAEKAGIIVTIKYLEKTEYGDGDSDESMDETSGVLIDASGLVLCSNSALGGSYYGEDSYMRSRATKLRVLHGDDTEGLEAAIIARDRELDLCWVKLKKPAPQPFPFLDLSRAASVVPGDKLLVVEKLGRYFDRAGYVIEGFVLGMLHKPREMYLTGLSGNRGLPAFTESGDFVGIFAMQQPDREDREADEESSYSAYGLFVLPGETVAKATKRALEVAGK